MDTTSFTRIGNMQHVRLRVRAVYRSILNAYVPQHRIVRFMNPTRTRQDCKSYTS